MLCRRLHGKGSKGEDRKTGSSQRGNDPRLLSLLGDNENSEADTTMEVAGDDTQNWAKLLIMEAFTLFEQSSTIFCIPKRW